MTAVMETVLSGAFTPIYESGEVRTMARSTNR